MNVTPTEGQLKVLRNIQAGQYELEGFIIEQAGAKAYFECIINGWVSRGKLTDAGHEVLKANPIRVKVTVIKS